MNYIELTNEYNKFMDSSGIRQFCTDKCIPHCCSHPTCTFKTCKKSLGCISFICYILIDWIFSKEEQKEWTKMHNKVLDKILWFNKDFPFNSSFRHYSPGMDAFEFDDKDFQFLFKLNKQNFKIRKDIKPITFIL